MRSHELIVSRGWYLSERGSESGLEKREPRLIRGGGGCGVWIGVGGSLVVVVGESLWADAGGGGSMVKRP